jgi:redox-sensitive bicupin YhaK (pirin superfamily)
MSNLDRTPSLTHSGRGEVSSKPAHQVFTGREVQLGGSPDGVGTMVRRLLPNLGRRLVGAWCFVDHYGPDDIANGPGMAVPPHPHMGLQTVSWLLEGQVHHRDSIGSDVVIGPGQLGLMTAGHAITHAEYSPVSHPSLLHGVQLWVALPSSARETAPSWEHHAVLPALEDTGMRVTVMMGTLAGATSPGTTHTPLVGVSVALDHGALGVLPLEPEFEHAVLVMSGAVEVDGEVLTVGSMLYLGCGRRDITLRADAASQLMLLGGEPFDEEIVMWWNFVGRSNEDIATAREQWAAGERFGVVTDAGTPLTAPPLPPGTLKPGGRTR